LTKQDERMRQRKRLIDEAIDLAAAGKWDEAIDTNLRLLEFGQDAEAYNRLGKAYLEKGEYDRAVEYYNETLQVNPSNTVARRLITRLEVLQQRSGGNRHDKHRTHAAPQIFIIETGKTALTTLTRLAPREVVMELEIGEVLHIDIVDDRDVQLKDGEDSVIGQLEPQLARRLIEMMRGEDGSYQSGNRYAAVVANLDAGVVKVLIREVYQAPSKRAFVSFPGRLGGDIAHFRTYAKDMGTRFDLEVDELQEDEELIEEEIADEAEDDFFRGGSDEEEVGLEAIEADINTDDEEDEDS
jgi:tetratricopeptide (TPR) repeat protein